MSQKFTPGLLLVVSCMMVGCTVNVTNPVTSVGVRANVPISAAPQAMAPIAAAPSAEPEGEVVEAPASPAKSTSPVKTEATPAPVQRDMEGLVNICRKIEKSYGADSDKFIREGCENVDLTIASQQSNPSPTPRPTPTPPGGNIIAAGGGN